MRVQMHKSPPGLLIFCVQDCGEDQPGVCFCIISHALANYFGVKIICVVPSNFWDFTSYFSLSKLPP